MTTVQRITLAAALVAGASACQQPKSAPVLNSARDMKSWLAQEQELTNVVAPRVMLKAEAPLYHTGAGGVFGKISKGVLFDDGRAVIGDNGDFRLTLLAANGAPSGQAGREGSGPGELKGVSWLMRAGSDTVFLGDGGLQRRTTFLAAPHALTLVKSTPFSAQPNAICRTRDTWIGFFFDPDRSTILNRISDSGAVTKAYGRPLVHAGWEVNNQVAQGEMICLPNGTTVVAAMTGDLFSYAADGTYLWRRTIADFVPIKITDLGGGAVQSMYAPPPGNISDAPGALLQLNDTLALLQLLVQKRVDAGGTSTVEWHAGFDTRIIDVRNGLQVGRQTDLPWILALANGRLLVAGDAPEPWVGVMPFAIVPATGPAHD